MLGWIVLIIILEVYTWTIDPPWLRSAWAFLSAIIASCFEIIRTVVGCVIHLTCDLFIVIYTKMRRNNSL